MPEDDFILLEKQLANGKSTEKSPKVEVLHVPLGKVIANPYQPRKQFDAASLAELSDSIREYGVLQPLLVTPFGDGQYLLIAGERRLRASKMAGITTIPVIISEYTRQQMAEIAMIENLQREDLHFLEEAVGYQQLLDKFNMTQDALAARIGKKQSTIANKLRLLKLSPAVLKVLQENQELTERHARVLLKLKREYEQLLVLKEVLAKHLNVHQTELVVDKLLAEDEGENARKRRIMIVNDVRIYLNSVKKIVSAIKDAGIPVNMQQEIEGDEVVVSLRIKNTKAKK